MKISVYKHIGDYTTTLDLEYDSKSREDKYEADKYISRMLLPDIMLPPDDGEPQNAEWISVDANLPEVHDVSDGDDTYKESAHVLVLCESGRIAVAQYGIYDGKIYWGGYDMGKEKVTHWMPLPEPPRK